MDKEELRRKLLNRVKGNYADYRADLLLKDRQELIDGAGRIARTAEVFQYFTEGSLNETEVEYLLKFQNPLELVTDCWERELDWPDPNRDVLRAIIADIDDKRDFDLDYPLAAYTLLKMPSEEHTQEQTKKNSVFSTLAGYDDAHCVRSSTLGAGAAIKNPATSLCSPVEGKLHLYQAAEKGCLYLDVSSMPESLMGKQSDLTILPDMIDGKPLVPVVTLNYDAATETRTLGLGNGSYSQGKEVNAGFEIFAKVQVGPVEYALGERGDKFPSYVTWERTPANDGYGPPNYYWGHYFESRDEAVRDFCNRASEKYEMLTENRKPSIKERLAAKPVPGDKPSAKVKSRNDPAL